MKVSARDPTSPLGAARCCGARGRSPPPFPARAGALSPRPRNTPRRVLLLAMLVGGCADSEDEARLQFEITHYEHLSRSAAPLHLAADSLAVEGRPGSILVTGTIRLPDHCGDLRARLLDRQPILELRLRQHQSRGHEGGCEESNRSVLVAYRAEIENLRPGTYRLRVLDEGHAEYVWLAGGSKAPESVTRLHDDTITAR